MKLIGLTLLALTASIASACADTPKKEEDFAALPVNEARAMIHANPVGQAHFKFSLAALQSRRWDLIQLCMDEPETTLAFQTESSKLDDTPFRDLIVLMMLRSTGAMWLPENHIGSRAAAQFPGPIGSAIHKYLPQVPLDPELVETRKSRLAIAADLEKAIKTYPASPPGHNVIVPPQPLASPSNTHVPSSPSDVAAPKNTPPDTSFTSESPANDRSQSGFGTITILGAFAGLLAYLAWRWRKRKR